MIYHHLTITHTNTITHTTTTITHHHHHHTHHHHHHAGRAWHEDAQGAAVDALHELLTLALSALKDPHTHVHDAGAHAMAELAAVLGGAGQHGMVLKLVQVLLGDVKVCVCGGWGIYEAVVCVCMTWWCLVS